MPNQLFFPSIDFAHACTFCGNVAPMTVVAEYNRRQSFDAKKGDRGLWELVECSACNEVLLRKGHWDPDYMDELYHELLYPSPEGTVDGLPETIDRAYMAALKVRAIDSNAFAVLLGRVLDLVCIDKAAQGASLFERLKDIADKGIIPQQLADMAHAMRQLRNIGAHADLGELTPAEVPILESLTKAILEYVYAAPALVALVQQKIDSFKTKKTYSPRIMPSP